MADTKISSLSLRTSQVLAIYLLDSEAILLHWRHSDPALSNPIHTVKLHRKNTIHGDYNQYAIESAGEESPVRSFASILPTSAQDDAVDKIATLGLRSRSFIGSDLLYRSDTEIGCGKTFDL